jgi:hypothetical protein
MGLLGMQERARRVADPKPAHFAEAPPIQPEPAQIIAYPCKAGVALIDQKQLSNHARKRRRKLALFIILETIGLLFLALALTGATSQFVRQAGLFPVFNLALIPAGLAVVVIPVIFFGMIRQKYRYRARRYRESR